MTAAVRPAAVAGTFYPSDAAGLERTVTALVEAARPSVEGRAGSLRPKALIAPHAGYRYSGPVAASAYATLGEVADRIERVVVVGPSHRVRLDGLATTTTGAFDTPLGAIPIDDELRARFLQRPATVADDRPHAAEHSLEVHLPFLQAVLGRFSLLPLAVGEAATDDVADVLEVVWGGEETLVVASTDLSHYHASPRARALDGATVGDIEALAADRLHPRRACGAGPVAGLLTVAQRRAMEVVTLDVRNSGDTAGPTDRVVGYASFALTEDAPAPLAASDQQALEALARAAILENLEGDEGGDGSAENDGSRRTTSIDPARLPVRLRRRGAAFVTLTSDGELRGCVGGVTAVDPLAAAVARHARSAAFADPRFPPLERADLPSTSVAVSVLSPLERLGVASIDELVDVLRPEVDGLVLAAGRRRATFLPAVWRQVTEPREFVRHLREKAGLPPDGWERDLRLHRYRTLSPRAA